MLILSVKIAIWKLSSRERLPNFTWKSFHGFYQFMCSINRALNHFIFISFFFADISANTSLLRFEEQKIWYFPDFEISITARMLTLPIWYRYVVLSMWSLLRSGSVSPSGMELWFLCWLGFTRSTKAGKTFVFELFQYDFYNVKVGLISKHIYLRNILYV